MDSVTNDHDFSSLGKNPRRVLWSHLRIIFLPFQTWPQTVARREALPSSGEPGHKIAALRRCQASVMIRREN